MLNNSYPSTRFDVIFGHQPAGSSESAPPWARNGPRGFLFQGAHMAKAIAFIDGFNLYHSIDDASKLNPKFTKYKWLNLKKLVSLFLTTDDELVDVFYFTSIAEWDADKSRKHKIYIQALQNEGVKTVYGNSGKDSENARIAISKTNFHPRKRPMSISPS
jgi:hypothetical protein